MMTSPTANNIKTTATTNIKVPTTTSTINIMQQQNNKQQSAGGIWILHLYLYVQHNHSSPGKKSGNASRLLLLPSSSLTSPLLFAIVWYLLRLKTSLPNNLRILLFVDICWYYHEPVFAIDNRFFAINDNKRVFTRPMYVQFLLCRD